MAWAVEGAAHHISFHAARDSAMLPSPPATASPSCRRCPLHASAHSSSLSSLRCCCCFAAALFSFSLLLASAAALLCVGLPVHAAVLEQYWRAVNGALCANRTLPSVTAGWTSADCVPNLHSDGALPHARLTCTVGGAVKYEEFRNAKCTGTADRTYSGSDKSCLAPGNGASSSDYFIDCAATVPSDTIVNSYRRSQTFSDSSCSTPLTDVAGLPTYDFVNVTGGKGHKSAELPQTGRQVMSERAALLSPLLSSVHCLTSSFVVRSLLSLCLRCRLPEVQ